MNWNNVFSVLVLVLVRLSAIVISFLVSWLITKTYSTHDAGKYLYVYTLIGVVAAISSLGLNQSMVRFFGENGINQRSNELLQIAIVWCLAATFFTVTFLCFSSNYFASTIVAKPELEKLIIASSFAVIGLVFASLFGHAFQGNKKPLFSLLFFNVLSNFIFVIFLSLQYFGLIDNLSVHELAKIYSLCCLTSALVAVFMWYLQPKTELVRLTFTNLDLFKSAVPLWLSQLSTLVLKHGSLLIAGIYIASSDIAKLSVTLRVSELMSLLLIALTLVTSPMYAKLWGDKEFSQLVSLVKRNIRFLGLFGLTMGLSMYLLSDFILGFFGDEYRDADTMLYILIIGQVIYITFASNINLLVMSGHEKQVMFCTTLVCLISVPMMFFLISQYNALGAAIAASISQALLVLGALLTVRLKLGFWAF